MNSGQYPVQMTRKPMQERGLKGVKNPKTPLGEPATGPSRSLRLRRSFRKSVSIYPRSAPGVLLLFVPQQIDANVGTILFLNVPFPMAMASCFYPYIPYLNQIPLLLICYGPNVFLGYIFIFCLGLVGDIIQTC